MRLSAAILVLACLGAQGFAGVLVDAGDHKIHLDCVGRGAPVVVVESGFDETTSDWAAVQRIVGETTRVCTYDRAGYGRSAPGPFPRTFDQINLELKTVLDNAGESGPFVLAGHSFGGPLVRNFAKRYPALVSGLVLVDAAHEDQQVVWGGAAHRLTEGAKGRDIPEPRMTGSAAPTNQAADHHATEDSERDWSAEYFARWHAHPQSGLLQSKPLLILARNSSSLGDAGRDGDVARERVLLQVSSAALSTDAVVLFVGTDHDMQKSIPQVVASSILDVVDAVRRHHALAR